MNFVNDTLSRIFIYSNSQYLIISYTYTGRTIFGIISNSYLNTFVAYCSIGFGT